MSVSKKIAFLGGGSLYFKHLLEGLAITEDLGDSRVYLYDLDLERATLMADYGNRVFRAVGNNLRAQVVKTLAAAVDGADFAIMNIGGAGGGGGGYYASKVHTNDLLICARHGIFQVVGDTVGPAAMMAAFRTVPVYLDICREMEKRCPNVVFLNHANPMAVLCRAMVKYSSLQHVIGICHGVQGGVRHAAHLLSLEAKDLDVTWVGTNHYYWFTRVFHKGRDVYPALKSRLAAIRPDKDKTMAAKLSTIFGYHIVYPEDDHIIEFYPYLAQVRTVAELPYALAESHHGMHLCSLLAPRVASGRRDAPFGRASSRRQILADFRDALATAHIPQKTDDWTAGENVSAIVCAIATGERHVHIVNIPNESSIPNLPEEAILEIEGVTNSTGIRPIVTGPAPRALMAQLHHIIAWQEMVTDAAVKGDRNLALQALMLDPAAILPEKAEKMLAELLRNSKNLLPQFFGT